MPQFTLLCVGALRENYIRQGCAEFVKRMTPFCRVEVREFRDDAALLAEFARPRERARRVALCVEGEELRSEQLAAWLARQMDGGSSSILFAIGGANGLNDDVKQAADLRLSLSRMTLPHELARLVLLEQLYRAWTILRGMPYHK